jgi:hypothetical protein
MTVFEGYKKVVAVSKDHPELIAEIDEFLEKGRNVAWITGRLNMDLRTLERPTLKPSELAGFLRHRRALSEKEQRRGKAKGIGKTKKNRVPTGDGVAIASSEPSQEKPGSRERAAEVDEERSVISDSERRRRTAEKIQRTHEEIVEWAADVARDLFLKAKEDPESDAGTVIRTLLITQVVANEEKMTEETVTKLIDEHRRSEQLQQDKIKLEMHNRQLESVIAFARQKTRTLQLANQDKAGKLKGVKKALSQRRMLSPDQIYDKISAVIGIGDVVVPRVEKQAPPG